MENCSETRSIEQITSKRQIHELAIARYRAIKCSRLCTAELPAGKHFRSRARAVRAKRPPPELVDDSRTISGNKSDYWVRGYELSVIGLPTESSAVRGVSVCMSAVIVMARISRMHAKLRLLIYLVGTII